MNKRKIICERLQRQRLTAPLEDSHDIEAYKQLFQKLQPIAPVFNSRPGEAPKLVRRTVFNDTFLAEDLRKKQLLVKGRFQGGRIGYVLEEDLDLYSAIFRKPIQKTTMLKEAVSSMIQQSGGISKEQLKEELPFKAREITAALKRLQEAFLVYESQVDTDWNTGWFDFKTEWPEVKLQEDTVPAAAEMLLRFLDAAVFATLDQMKSWTQLKRKTIQSALTVLMEREAIIKIEVEELGEGFIQKKDLQLTDEEIPQSVFMLDKSDFLVRADLDKLKEQFKGKEVLQYLLIDGEFKGAVLGHWRIGPHDIEDIVLCLGEEETETRKEEIISAVRAGYSVETSCILRFNGEQIC
ncbi:DNA glycosylase AlkZ-like family protein [Oceanobacillus sp. CFH 90083]|uniref:DNA glycosylase AlkZ-like family protein n=1 Tax=Oceanobacillus sp. CFH 90083 TaxID=2592336 RepID=UPI00128D9233|nr:crosslink repair DNA glycosylase YcaQ family protein [Oceanobacillus sp. CFH 90083]